MLFQVWCSTSTSTTTLVTSVQQCPLCSFNMPSLFPLYRIYIACTYSTFHFLMFFLLMNLFSTNVFSIYPQLQPSECELLENKQWLIATYPVPKTLHGVYKAHYKYFFNHKCIQIKHPHNTIIYVAFGVYISKETTFCKQ